MVRSIIIFQTLILFFGCKSYVPIIEATNPPVNFTIAFGSCNKTTLPNHLWDDVLESQPDLWIWGGDIIYADTDNINVMRKMYNEQQHIDGYQRLKAKVPVIGTWDDHDYGLNDGGSTFSAKKDSQQAFLDFMEVPKDGPRRTQEGIYASHEYDLPRGSVKVIVLDTRYFRTDLSLDTLTKKRFRPNEYGTGTVLGQEQWDWLENELNASNADFNLIVSSIQVLSNEHGFESWGNFPHERERLMQLIASSKANGVIVLSGDRHISEFSRLTSVGMDYPLIDFTSSGLTHVYKGFSGETNPYRVGEVVAKESFGLLQLNFESRQVHFKMIAKNGELLGSHREYY